jgi:polar amino acid transport system substrate-binding protein
MNLFKDANKVTFVEQTMDARLPNLVAGKVDFTIEALTLTAPRAQVAEFTFPYFRDGSTTLTLANSPYNGAKDMTGHHLRVSAYDNGFADQIIHAGIPDAVLVGFSSDALALQAMEAGDVPVFSASVANAGYLVSQHPGKYKLGNFTWFPQSYGIAVAPGDSRWLNFLNVNIKEMATGVDNDFFRGLYKKYLGTDLPVVPSGFPVEYGVH